MLPSRYMYEERLWSARYLAVAGLDEVGRGCLAGPVVAAAVILPPSFVLPTINDSKCLTPKARVGWSDYLQSVALAIGIGMVEAPEIDRINIHVASLKAMGIALARLAQSPDYLLIDGRHRVDSSLPQTPIVGGDGLSQSIAAASIIAKVARDRLMADYEAAYPGYEFAAHKGYGTPAHLAAIAARGLTPLHRRSFAPCRLSKESDSFGDD